MEVLRGSILHCGGGVSASRGVLSMESRRKFLRATIAVGLPAGILSLLPLVQVRAKRQQSPQQQKDDEPRPPKLDPKLILEANQKEIKKNVEKLFELASELKAEVEKTNSVQVLSVAMLKKTEEIEKLAKEIRSRAIG